MSFLINWSTGSSVEASDEDVASLRWVDGWLVGCVVTMVVSPWAWLSWWDLEPHKITPNKAGYFCGGGHWRRGGGWLATMYWDWFSLVKVIVFMERAMGFITINKTTIWENMFATCSKHLIKQIPRFNSCFSLMLCPSNDKCPPFYVYL